MLMLAAGIAVAYFLAVTHLAWVALGQPLRHALRKKIAPRFWPFLPDYLRPSWVSNIPGSPYAVDDLTIGAVAPFPECNDHNAILLAVPLPVVLTGVAPPAAYWSVQAFIKGKEAIMDESIICDREMKIGSDGCYELVLGSAAACEAAVAAGRPKPANFINTGDAAKCMIGIRAFQVPNGRMWRAPTVRSLAGSEGSADGPAWPLASEERTAGPVATERATRCSAPVVVVALSAALVAVVPSVAPTLVLGACGALGLRMLFLRRLAAKYWRMAITERRSVFNQSVNNASARHSLKGSSRHMYFSMPYDAQTCDVEIKGVLRLPEPPGVSAGAAFRYTSLTAYHFNSLPLPQYLDGSSILPDANDRDRFTARLTCTPRGLPNEINVTEAPVGVCCLRLVYPQSEAVVEAAKPTIRAVPGPAGARGAPLVSPKWRRLFVLAGVSNVLQCLFHFTSVGGRVSTSSLIGFQPSILEALTRAVSPTLWRMLPLPAAVIGANDALTWTIVGLSGLAYASHGLHGSLHPVVVVVFALLKYQVAASCFLIYLRGVPGAATLPICILETGLGSAFLWWALCVCTSPAGAGTVVHLRNLWHVLNWTATKLGMLPFQREKLTALHDAVLAIEREAFGDSPAIQAAKRSLFELQADGVTAEGNRFTPLGRLLLSSDIKKRLHRRMRFAQLLIDDPIARQSAARPVTAPVIIAGLPRTGSTFLHRLLAATRTRALRSGGR